MLRLLAALGLAMTATLGQARLALADSLPQIWGHGGERAIDIEGDKSLAGVASDRGESPVPLVTVLIPACDGNQPTLVEPKEAMCVQAADLCAHTPDPRDAMFWTYTASKTGSGELGSWRRTGHVCIPPEGQQGGIPAMSERDFQRLPLPGPQINVQPRMGQVLVNIQTNVYVGTEVVRLRTSLLGFPVRVRATPIAYAWNFGDGRALRTTDPGGPFPEMRTTHIFRSSGVFSIGLTTTYSGEYSVADGPWLPVEGEADVPSASVSVTVMEAENRLVAEPLDSTLQRRRTPGPASPHRTVSPRVQ